MVRAGDICAFTGMSDVGIGETVCDSKTPVPLPTIKVRRERSGSAWGGSGRTQPRLLG